MRDTELLLCINVVLFMSQNAFWVMHIFHSNVNCLKQQQVKKKNVNKNSESDKLCII